MQRQLAVLLDVPVSEIEYDFTLIDTAWEEKGGASAALLLAYCSKFRLSCYIFWADRLIQRVVCPNAAMCVCALQFGMIIAIFTKRVLEQQTYANR